MSNEEFLRLLADVLQMEGAPSDVLYEEAIYYLREYFGDSQ